jgi:hypothetical protein
MADLGPGWCYSSAIRRRDNQAPCVGGGDAVAGAFRSRLNCCIGELAGVSAMALFGRRAQWGSSCKPSENGSIAATIDVVDVKVSASDRRTASCSLPVPRNTEARGCQRIDSPSDVGLELRFV